MICIVLKDFFNFLDFLVIKFEKENVNVIIIDLLSDRFYNKEI